MKTYFTGVPCPRGHVGPRYASNRACVVCTQERSKAWYSDPVNSNKIAEKNRQWWASHKDGERSREWRAANPERTKQLTREWRAANAEKFKSKRREWWAANKTKKSVYLNAYRSRKRSNGGSHTAADIDDLFAIQRGHCAACREPLSARYHVDHIVALKNGGSNDRRNLQILCQHCNSTKSARCPIEFMQSLGWLL